MDTEETSSREQPAAEQSLFPTAVSEEELDEARRKSSINQLFSFRKRPDLPGSLIIQSKAAEHYRNGQEAVEKCQYEKAVTCFSKAIFLLPGQTQLYVSQGEAYLQLCDFQSAVACYKRALQLEPGAFGARLAAIYYIQGQCLFDRGLFLEALEAFSKAAEVKPGCRAYEVRRLACLSAVGRNTECLKVVNDWMAAEDPTADLHILRARLHKRLNQSSHCYQDVKAALALNPTCPQAGALLLQLQEASEQTRQMAVDCALCGQLPAALCMINIALESSPQDGRLHLFRGTLYRRLKDFTAAIEDLVQAMELSKEEEEHEEGAKEVRGQAEARDKKDETVQEEAHCQLVLTYNDFAVQCFGRGLYAEASLLLNKAIDEEKGLAGLYLNRGDCFFKQGDWLFALADYQQAEEMMRRDEPAVRLRLAVVHNTLGSIHFQDGRFQEAADMLSLAIKYNPAASQYYESRAKAFRKALNMTEARQDFICMLILDPSNEEVPPMLMSLFHGSSVSDVLSSPKGQAVRAQLMDTIQAYSCPPDPQRLSEELHEMSLTDEHTASRSDEAAARQEQQLCAQRQGLQVKVEKLQQVEEAVKSLVRNRPTLHHTGPSLSTRHPPPPSASLPFRGGRKTGGHSTSQK